MSTRTIKSLTLLLIVAIIGIGTMSLAWPRLQASLSYLPVETAIDNYYNSREIPTDQLLELIARAGEAIQQHDHYRYREGLSLLYFLRGMDSRSPTMERNPAFRQSLQQAETALTTAPVRPLIWQRIAYTHDLLRHSTDEVIAALNMSIYTGRVEPELFIGRLELGGRYLEWMDAEAKGLLRDQALLAWKLQPRPMLKAIKQQRIDWPSMQQLLASHNQPVLDEMEISLGTVR